MVSSATFTVVGVLRVMGAGTSAGLRTMLSAASAVVTLPRPMAAARANALVVAFRNGFIASYSFSLDVQPTAARSPGVVADPWTMPQHGTGVFALQQIHGI